MTQSLNDSIVNERKAELAAFSTFKIKRQGRKGGAKNTQSLTQSIKGFDCSQAKKM